MRISGLTAIAFCANMMLDQKQSAPFSFDDIALAAREGRLVELCLKIDDGGVIELITLDPEYLKEVNRSLQDAGGAFDGQELRKFGVGDNPLCAVIAICLEAIQQLFRRL